MSVRFLIADRSHDAGIRRLLRETPMGGRDMSVSLQCEPSYFDAVAAEGDHHAIIAIDAGEVVCVGGVSIRERYYNGRLARVGYLGHLRLAASHAGRTDVLRRGYAVLRDLRVSLRPDACFTCIAADNVRARRLLERGIRGLPRYRPAGELATLLFRRPGRGGFAGSVPTSVRRTLREAGLGLRHGDADLRPLVADLSRRLSPAGQFAPVWTADPVQDTRFRFLLDRRHVVGCAAIWDRRAATQAVVAGYSRRLSMVRRAYNGWVTLSRRGVPLPAAGRTVPQAFVSHVLLPGDRADWFALLMLSLSASARTDGADVMAVGLDGRDPRLPALIRQFRPHVFRTTLYMVDWADAPPADPPDGRLLNPEIATL